MPGAALKPRLALEAPGGHSQAPYCLVWLSGVKTGRPPLAGTTPLGTSHT